ncbi:MAG: hypothetical protein BroJett021_35750 [Chloroflexota bacterium]|nr:hypothetical protein [Caldilinea sp.]GIK74587.1 MAG: hypothetical protein BroJett021_35750 [Chloroflexota bacterium]
MMKTCPQCGARLPSNDSCQQRFDQCMALEYESPAAFGTVHHLTVTCYMLQHNAYARDAWLQARTMLAQFVRDDVTPAEMRQKNRSQLDSGQRAGHINRGAKLTEFDTIRWTSTIADVRFDDCEIYCADVARWALSVLADTEHIT